ncbi:hypothetical protein [Streptomyces sp. NBC_01764]|uniref:hypothetical protein n=1 Tax=Streptomyces sp. NBC_01764 TaxID=2975935 RepID=UPI002B1CB186|nr:hypothetical protein [Streptomyces sp. NBC_01764]
MLRVSGGLVAGGASAQHARLRHGEFALPVVVRVGGVAGAGLRVGALEEVGVLLAGFAAGVAAGLPADGSKASWAVSASSRSIASKPLMPPAGPRCPAGAVSWKCRGPRWR